MTPPGLILDAGAGGWAEGGVWGGGGGGVGGLVVVVVATGGEGDGDGEGCLVEAWELELGREGAVLGGGGRVLSPPLVVRVVTLLLQKIDVPLRTLDDAAFVTLNSHMAPTLNLFSMLNSHPISGGPIPSVFQHSELHYLVFISEERSALKYFTSKTIHSLRVSLSKACPHVGTVFIEQLDG